MVMSKPAFQPFRVALVWVLWFPGYEEGRW